MIRIVKKLSLEVTQPNIIQAIVAKQYDMNSRFLKVTLTDCGTRIDVPMSAKVVINAERVDGQSDGFEGEVNEDGTVTVPLHSWMLELEGTVICDISVIDTTSEQEKKLTTTSFTLMVEKAAYGGSDIATDPQYDVLVDLIERVENIAIGSGGTVDQEYKPQSEYAQSGKAVAEAVKNKMDKFGEVSSLTNNDGTTDYYITVPFNLIIDGNQVKLPKLIVDEIVLNNDFRAVLSASSDRVIIDDNLLVYGNVDATRQINVWDGASTSIQINPSNGLVMNYDGNRKKIVGVATPDGTDVTAVINIEYLNNKLGEVIETALAEAKASGEFDGADGSNGKDGTSVTVTNVTTSNADGGSNVVTFSDGKTLTVKNGGKGSSGTNGTNGSDGVGIKSVVQTTTSSADGGSNVITVTKTDGTTSTFTVKNGSKGSKGDKGDTGSDYVITDADKNELLAEVRAMSPQQTPLFANSVEECTDTTKVYVLPDGYIYGHIKVFPTITYETHANSQLDGSGTLKSASGIQAKLSNQIPCKEGDQFIYTGNGKWNSSVLWLSSKITDFTVNNTAKIVLKEVYGSSTAPQTVTVTAPAGAKYVLFASWEYNSPGVTLEVTPLTASVQWASTGHAFIPADYENRILALENKSSEVESILKGKKIVYDGDSIAESRTGSSANNGGGYAKLIAEKVGGTYVNQAVGGAYLRSTTVSGKHSVTDNLANLPKDADLYCFEGGINDYWNNATLGTFSKTDFTGTLDKTTVCGALETIFRYALNNFVGKPICFVIVHKIQSTAYTKNSSGNTFEDYRNAMVGICEKYSIPYYDAFSESGLNGWNSIQNNNYLTANSSGTADGTHPNAEGYKRYYVPQLISLFESIMPI